MGIERAVQRSFAVLLWVSAACTAGAIIVGDGLTHGATVLLLVVALAAQATLVVRAGRRRERSGLDRRAVLAASGLVLLIAVLVPPRGSHDLWSYAMYGRIVSHHHASPFVHRPSEYTSDPWLHHVDRGWRHTRSVYGPAFVAVSAVITFVARVPLVARLLFQGLAAAAIFGILLLIDRRTRDPVAVVCIGLHPIIAFEVVNGGHNDALVGLAVLAAVLLVTRERWVWAGLVLALGVLVKAVVLLPFAALAVWTWRRYGVRAAASLAAAGTSLVVVAYALAGGRAALAPLAAARLQESRASLWSLPKYWITADLVDDGWRGKTAGLVARHLVSSWSLLVVLGLAVALLVGRLKDPAPALAAGGATLAYLLAAAYVLPWYVVWALPVLALQWRAGVARLAAIHASLLLIAYQYNPGPHLDALQRALRLTVRGAQAFEVVAILALLAVALARALGRRPHPVLE